MDEHRIKVKSGVHMPGHAASPEWQSRLSSHPRYSLGMDEREITPGGVPNASQLAFQAAERIGLPGMVGPSSETS